MGSCERLVSGKPYPLADQINHDEAALFGVERGSGAYQERRRIMAVWTGEKRPPRAGEWYLSGAKIEAYRAWSDLETEYHIARLVKVETKTVTRIVG